MPMDNRLMVPRRNYDADALRYLNAVQLADGQALEPEIQAAVDAFVRGCKADGIWDAIKASCIMCGARTISGALVPLTGSAPTPFNFASGDYSRTTGLVGDGSTKYLDSNRANNTDGKDDNHNAVFVSASGSTAVVYIAAGSASGQENGSNNLGVTDAVFCRNRSALPVTGLGSASSTGVLAVSRSSSSEISTRTGGTTLTSLLASQAPLAEEVTVFARRSGATVGFYSDARLAFYSIGSSLDLAALDNRVSTLVAAIAAAI